jgi:P-type Cu+ transporter
MNTPRTMADSPTKRPPPQKVTSQCSHCGLQVPVNLNIHWEDKIFCCYGCKNVFQILNATNDVDVDDLQKNFKLRLKLNDLLLENTVLDYMFLDSPKAVNEFASFSEEKSTKTMFFYLENITCAACLWFIEKISESYDEIESISLNLSTSIARVEISLSTPFAKVAALLSHLGFPPKVINHQKEALVYKKKEEKDYLIKIAVSAFCAGNIMLFAVSQYSGAAGVWSSLFDMISAFLFLPIVFFAATPFYKSSLIAFKNKNFSIEIPIAITFLAGTLISYAGFLFKIEGMKYYFDSLSVFIFLILFARYLTLRVQNKINSQTHGKFFFWNQTVSRLTKESETRIEIEDVIKGDVIKVKTNEIVPTHSLLISDMAFLNTAFITGEGIPIEIRQNEQVMSGVVNLGDDIIVESGENFHSSTLNKLFQEFTHNWQKEVKVVEVSSRASQVLLILSLILSTLTFMFYFSSDFSEAVNRSLSILIVTCPCALALGNPLVYGHILNFFQDQKILVKNGNVLERIWNAKNIFLDKTGTLTKGNFDCVYFPKEALPYKFHILALESYSHHPIAKSLVRYIKLNNPEVEKLKVENFQEDLGRGVQGIVDGVKIELKKAHADNLKSSALNQVLLRVNDEDIGHFHFSDRPKEYDQELIQTLKNLGLSVHLLSGDKKENVRDLATRLQIDSDKTYFETTPEDKKQIVGQKSHSIMVGDGANDIMGLNTVDVGIALSTDNGINLDSTDVFFKDGNLQLLSNFLTIAFKVKRIILGNVILALTYNVVGVILAVLGVITPLAAAILMPLSSLTVVVSTYIGTEKLKHFKGTK